MKSGISCPRQRVQQIPGCPILCGLCKGWDTRRSVSRFVVSHPSQKTRRMGHPGICCTFCRGQEMPPFISRGSSTPVDDCRESRMKFADPAKPYRKSGGMGCPPDLLHVRPGNIKPRPQLLEFWREMQANRRPLRPPPGKARPPSPLHRAAERPAVRGTGPRRRQRTLGTAGAVA